MAALGRVFGEREMITFLELSVDEQRPQAALQWPLLNPPGQGEPINS